MKSPFNVIYELNKTQEWGQWWEEFRNINLLLI